MDEVETKQKIIFYSKREYNRTATNTNAISILTARNHHQSSVSSVPVTNYEFSNLYGTEQKRQKPIFSICVKCQNYGNYVQCWRFGC